MPTFPLLTRFEVDDPDNGDEEYSVGDVLVIGFNMDTNAPSCSGSGIARVSCPIVNGSVVSTALTDHLFSFSDPIGADYSGEWATPRRFMVTILDPTGADVEQGRTTVTLTLTLTLTLALTLTQTLTLTLTLNRSATSPPSGVLRSTSAQSWHMHPTRRGQSIHGVQVTTYNTSAPTQLAWWAVGGGHDICSIFALPRSWVDVDVARGTRLLCANGTIHPIVPILTAVHAAYLHAHTCGHCSYV